MAKTLAEEWALDEIDRLKNTVEWHVRSCVDFEREIVNLKALLDKYGGHKRNCRSQMPYAGPYKDIPRCDCGYDEAMKRLKA